MSRGGSFGGGQSSLGYLFGSGSEATAVSAPASPPTVQPPPYGIESDASTTDTVAKSSPKSSSTSDAKHSPSNNNYQRSQGQNFGNFITDRPSTKVTSAPGGDSSIGYLFEDK